ncbi:MAG TPA: hypothetical protein VFW93_13110 [Aquabacterium sp.]|uniref:hypothetical protein n=1 Tax=Aquabacterium sp. TaxID=1872578 RepID=UPI002E2FA5F0|nr:hypothetical protein [Aquabacterium sp.]HEX5357153.1 hypothetical protein [Aquabacterium sp.]
MNTGNLSSPSWSTSSFGHGSDTSAGELATLGAHLDLCRRASGKLFLLQCHAESMKGFMSSRIVTTLVLFVLVIGLASVIL